ncbi:PTS sugar transporter subunit IIB [Enterococcus raffinosus]|jgi:PTS system cellobiose-specific IIB component|uniref:PTS sugar transporter subunit IIB n=1 Tax=Enterococcus raffinosus TaxID=71452 RepID=A0AAW8SZI4_9ENTE|nr:PTS sugar transporter subunit IIB [Enterococcus raffinosus]MBS6432615.1 PTS sugar transporter subunit IIB [Enterococcus raffinosus]MDK7992609.1 PTS sugar transporter subunit IIB [Enterococcus raffinosus]MDT2540245.1 PTS sugar transporter subunit IIB [Enterococcus raffinosus]MDT2573847.1 PTS sugar transporter subunit IIB [Enterococcus raffinosus]QXJ61129.1 PTS sugar transporter subunit IIB [Enterococcus raffinosus]
MKTIMLVCSAGMSTSLLVTKMEAAAKDENFDADIFAVSATEANGVLAEKNVDVLLLGPQVRFMLKQFEEKVASKNIPVAVIDMADYGMMNGQKVLQEAKQLMNQ